MFPKQQLSLIVLGLTTIYGSLNVAAHMLPSTLNEQALNIFMSAAIGTWSHASPLLTLSDTLVARGHSVAFAGYNNTLPGWMKNYPRVQSVGMGINTALTVVPTGPALKLISTDGDMDLLDSLDSMYGLIVDAYEESYNFYKHYFANHPVDVVVCDFFTASCIDAAHEAKLPFVITAPGLSITANAQAPYISSSVHRMPSTYEDASFLDRFYDLFLVPIRAMFAIKDVMARQHAVMTSLGLKPYHDFMQNWGRGMVLVNSFFGMEPARPLPPNTHLIGPHIPHTFSPLSDDLREFMDTRKRVVYVGFGSAAVVAPKHISAILYAILAAHRDGLLDGAIWGLMLTGDTSDSMLPTVTIDGVAHSIADMRSGKHPVIRLLNRAPQRAILEHPSTKLFMSHCGISSVYETMYAGVPIIGLPVFADQDYNAIRMHELDAGSELNKSTLGKALVQMLSPGSEIREKAINSIAKLKKMIHIVNRDHTRGADLIELAAIPGALQAYETADMRMPWWKARNYDLYAFALGILATIIYVSVYLIRYVMLSPYLLSKRKQKQAYIIIYHKLYIITLYP
ncbi:hypothetical protein BDF22DRAFT_664711 [Syncephalis plumigaleata]|nr:hypothetical protein BDF22DRAFT_664711 [Syncephalis plumigaleata]